VSYELAVWEGSPPPSNEAAMAIYTELIARLEDDAVEAPSDRIRQYVDALVAKWPDMTDDEGTDSPWADGSMPGTAIGSAIYFSMSWSCAAQASHFAADLAAEHGLVCFDPQTESLRPGATVGGGHHAIATAHRPNDGRIRRFFKRRSAQS
jgi:hypothetical protein